jgi:O-methyltransferase
VKHFQHIWSRLFSPGRPAASAAECEAARIRALADELGRLQQARQADARQVAELMSRVAQLEARVINYWRHRWDAIDQVVDYLAAADVPGDYMEFGVYRGNTFTYAYRMMAPVFAAMRFLAADSFEGLPAPAGIDVLNGYASKFYAGQFACSEQDFRKTLDETGVDWQRVLIVKGWFQDSLTAQIARQHTITGAAAAWIDCDLYESTVPVLKFLTPLLSIGSVLLFDDWRCFRNLPDRGQQRACREWLDANPQMSLQQLLSFGFGGQAFTVKAC